MMMMYVYINEPKVSVSVVDRGGVKVSEHRRDQQNNEPLGKCVG